MALQTQLIDIPFIGGISSKLDKVIADKNRLFSLSNATLNKNGIVMPRDTLANLAAVSGVSELATLGNELVAINGTTGALSSYSPTGSSLISRGTVPFMALSKTQISRSVGNIAALDSAHTNGYTCFAWLQLGAANAVTGVYVSIVDEASGTFILSGTQLSSSVNAGAPRVCVNASGKFTIAWGDGTTINATILNASSGSVGVGVTALAAGEYIGTATATPFDLISLGSGNMLLTYGTNLAAGADSLAARVYDSTLGAVTGSLVVATQAAFPTIKSVATAIYSSATSIAVAVQPNGASAATAILSWSGGVLSIAHAMAGAGLTSASSGAVSLVYDNSSMHLFDFPFQGGAGVKACRHALVTTGNAIGSITTLVNSMQFSGGLNGPNMAGKAFLLGGSAYVPIAMVSDLQPGLFVMDTSGNIQAVAMYGSLAATTNSATVGILATWGGMPPGSPILSTGQASIAAPQQGQLSFSNGVNVTASGVARIQLSLSRTLANSVKLTPTPLWHAQVAGSLYFSGSYLAMYDGAAVSEAGFLYFPENLAIANGGGAGAMTGTYLFCAVYEWIDGQGRRHQSAPSPSFSKTLDGAHAGVTYQASTLLFGKRAANCSVVFYRTVNAGQTFYRINPVNNSIANNTATDNVGGTDTTMTTVATSDPITANEILYTTGGALPNDNPVACNAVAAWQGRLIYSNAEDGQEWRFSQAPVLNQGLYFNESLLGGRTNQDTGTISAFGVLDDKLIVCTPTRKYWTSGQGPASDGFSGGSFATPQLLPSAVGCIDQRTLVVIPDADFVEPPLQQSRPGGLAHATTEGLYLLTRGLTDSYIGSAMDSSTSSAYYNASTIGPGTIQTDKGQVRWCNGANGTMVYDYIFGQWSNFSFRFSNSAVVPVASIIWNNKWTVAATNNAGDGIAQDTAIAAGKDFGTDAVSIFGQTNWFHLASLQGYQRVRRVVFFGPYGGAGSIEVDAYADYDETGTASAPSQPTAGLLTPDGLRWQFRWHLPIQKCQAVKFDFFFTPSTASGGCGFSGITIELGMKKGTAKLPAGQSV